MSHPVSTALSPSLLAWLRCFDAAARCGSFTRAAEELHVSPGAVSQQVKKLEERVRLALFVRLPTGLQLTQAGHQLFLSTRGSFDDLEQAVKRLSAAHTADPLNISCSPSLAMLWLTLRLGSLYGSNPYLALRVVGETEHPDPARMRREGVAAAIRFSSPGKDETGGFELMDEWLVPVAAPSFLQENPALKSCDDLVGAHLLHAADPLECNHLTQEWAEWGQAVGRNFSAAELRQGTQFNLSLLAVQAALGGQGIALGRLALVQGYLMQGRLVPVFRQRVLSLASYRVIESKAHTSSEIILNWLVNEARLFKERRDAYFDREDIAAV